MQPRRKTTMLELTSQDTQKALNMTVEDLVRLQSKAKSPFNPGGGAGNSGVTMQSSEGLLVDSEDAYAQMLRNQAAASVQERIGTIRSSYNQSRK